MKMLSGMDPNIQSLFFIDYKLSSMNFLGPVIIPQVCHSCLYSSLS